MIDKTQPPPGWHFVGVDGSSVSREATLTSPRHSRSLVEAHHIYAEESRPAVVDFAERVAAWLAGTATTEWANRTAGRILYPDWVAEQILAAARGERSLP